jgi:hypothetical protein
VYAAEQAAFGGTDLDEPCHLDVLRARVVTVAEGDWWRRACAPPVRVVAARADARSSSARHGGQQAVIRLANDQFDLATVAHELAHVLAGIEHGHDERFRAAHVDVVAVVAGAGPAGVLAESYRSFGLGIGARTWPSAYRGLGDGFVIVP